VTAQIIAAAHEVHRALGPGFEETIYQRALARELPTHDLEFAERCGSTYIAGAREWGESRRIW
jgi:GxxExxY protein